MHWGVILTIVAIRENYGIPRLRQIAKGEIRNYFDSIPNHSLHSKKTFLRQTELQEQDLFKQLVQNLEVESYRKCNREEKNAYIPLFTCCLAKGIYLKLLPDQTADEFKRALKRLIA